MAKAKAPVNTEGKVKVMLPRAPHGEAQEYFVCINGVGYLVPRGKESFVPPEVAEELDRSNVAVDKMYEDKEQRLAAARA